MPFAIMLVAATTLTGCRVVHSAHQVSGSPPPAISAGNQHAAAVCTQRDPRSDFSLAVFAKTAAGGLSHAHVTPNPWARMAPDTVIFACFVASNGLLTQGEYVDSSGDITPVPEGTYNACLPPSPGSSGPAVAPPATVCSFRLGVRSSRSFNPAIAAVLGVIAVAVIWFVARRRRRPAAF